MSDFRKWMAICEMELNPSRLLLSELKSYEELFGPNAIDIEQEEDDLIKSEKALISRGWHKIPWKHPLGIFELTFVNPKFRSYKIFLMDLKRWEVEGSSNIIGEGQGVEELEGFMDEIFGNQ